MKEPEVRKLSRKSAERLMQVVRVLDELPKGKKFNLSHWYKCGSVACACGWAATDPWFRRRGFTLNRIPSGLILINTHVPHYRGWTMGDAAEEFFDLTRSETEYLFFPNFYGKGRRRDVINRIRRFVEKRT